MGLAQADYNVSSIIVRLRLIITFPVIGVETLSINNLTSLVHTVYGQHLQSSTYMIWLKY